MFILPCQVTFTVPGITNKGILGVEGVFPSTVPFLSLLDFFTERERMGGE